MDVNGIDYSKACLSESANVEFQHDTMKLSYSKQRTP